MIVRISCWLTVEELKECYSATLSKHYHLSEMYPCCDHVVKGTQQQPKLQMPQNARQRNIGNAPQQNGIYKRSPSTHQSLSHLLSPLKDAVNPPLTLNLKAKMHLSLGSSAQGLMPAVSRLRFGFGEL